MEKRGREGLWELCDFLPKRLVQALENCDEASISALTEIRLRRDRPVTLCEGGKIFFLGEKGIGAGEPVVMDAADMAEALRLVTASSLYALEDELRRGYVTVAGGHRVGVAGTAVTADGVVRTQKDIASLNYRRARELKGIGAELLPDLDVDGYFGDTLIFSPPGAGKTTLLRDVTRLLSDGSTSFRPLNVAVIDERGEIAGVTLGRRRFDVGGNTDVLTGFPKGEGMTLALRSLGPAVLVCDEIGGEADRRAVSDAVRGGVTLLATAHAGSLAELRRRPILRELLQEGVFSRLVALQARPRPGTVAQIYARREKGEGFDYVAMARGGTAHRCGGSRRRGAPSGAGAPPQGAR